MNYKPHEFVTKFEPERDAHKFRNLKHRFYTAGDIVSLFNALKKIYTTYGSLKYLFLLYYFEKDKNLKEAVSFFSRHLTRFAAESSGLTRGIKFMFPDPHKGSVCKRMNLFLRWMIRRDELDFGIWHEIPPSQLVIPVDTHVARICRKIGLTKRKSLSWLMAEEITEKLRKFDPADPVKYDFAICHIGMRKLKF
jgi:uncharacterized protein (TIGR02757 family)